MTDPSTWQFPRPSNKGSGGGRAAARSTSCALELGLILVSLDPSKPPVEIVFHPLPFARRKRAKSRRAVLQEIAARSADYNRAGSTRTKLATAYRENAIHIACCLFTREHEPRGPAGPGHRAEDTLHPPFQRVRLVRARRHGVYALSAHGAKDLGSWPELKKHYLAAARRAARKTTAAKSGLRPGIDSCSDRRYSRMQGGRSDVSARGRNRQGAHRPVHAEHLHVVPHGEEPPARSWRGLRIHRRGLPPPAEKDEVKKEIKKWNPDGSYPTMVINDKDCVSGFDEAEIREKIK